MEQQLLEVLIKLDTKLDNLEKNMLCIQDEIKDIKQDIKDRFDVTDIKLNVIENKVTQVSRKLDTTTDQVARNIETIEEVKMRLQ